MWRSTAPPFVLERRNDTSRKGRWAAALDQLDQRMQVHAALARELLRQLAVKAGLAEPGLAPRDDARRRFAGGPSCAVWVHASFSAVAPALLTVLSCQPGPRQRRRRPAVSPRAWSRCSRAARGTRRRTSALRRARARSSRRRGRSPRPAFDAGPWWPTLRCRPHAARRRGRQRPAAWLQASC